MFTCVIRGVKDESPAAAGEDPASAEDRALIADRNL
jgi:hypothetical protein